MPVDGLPASLLKYTWDTPHFRFFYTYTSDLTAQTDRRYDPRKPTSERHGVTSFAYVENCAAYFENAWQHYFAGPVRYPLPPGPDIGELYRVYLYDIVLGGTRPYGVTFPDRVYLDGRWRTYIAIRNNYAGFPPNDDPNPELGALKVAVAHEFFHTVQFGLPGGTYDYWRWWMETSATFMEDQVFDSVNDYLAYLPAWFGAPELPLDLCNSSHEYGTVVLAKHLAEKHGGPAVIQRIWSEYSAGVPDALTAIHTVLRRKRINLADGRNREMFATGFAVANLLRDDPVLGYEEGRRYPAITFACTHTASTPAPVRLQLDHLSTAYIAFCPAPTAKHLAVTLNVGPVAGRRPPIRATAVLVRANAAPELRPVHLRKNRRTGGYAGRLDVANLAAGRAQPEIVLVLANVTWGADAADNVIISYEAEIT